jgi:dodecin
LAAVNFSFLRRGTNTLLSFCTFILLSVSPENGSPPGKSVYLFTIKMFVMPIVKVIEVIAKSEKSIDDAIRSAVTEASKTIRNIDSIYVKDIKAHVKDGEVSTFGVICKISFRLD